MNPWEGAVKAVYADSYLKALAATCNVKRAQDAAFARIAKGIENVRASDSHYEAWHCDSDGPPCRCEVTDKDAAALAAFTEASR